MGLVSNALTYIKYDVIPNYIPNQGLWYYNSPEDETWDIAGSCIMISDMDAQRDLLAKFVYEDLVKK